MAWIYDISKNRVINSHQILSAHFEIEKLKFQIKVLMSAGTGDGGFGAYGSPITYTVYEQEFSSIFDARIHENTLKQKAEIQASIQELETKLAAEMSKPINGINTKIADLRYEINTLKDEYENCGKPEKPDIGSLVKDKNQKQKEQGELAEIGQQARFVFNKFLKLISNPEFDNSKEPIDLFKIL